MSDKGYRVKIKGSPSVVKKPFFCPYENCRRPTGTIDDKYMVEYGICALCYTMYVEERKKPLLDVEFYRKRLEERGY